VSGALYPPRIQRADLSAKKHRRPYQEGSFDSQGNITPGATEARNVGGGFANETLTGSWTVNPDCTGTLTIHAYEAGILVRTSVLSIVFVDNLNKGLMVQDSLTLPDGTVVPAVITAEGERIFPLSSNQQ
jgi:hypothetical protein